MQCRELQGDIKVQPAQKSDIKYRDLLLHLENVCKKCHFQEIQKHFTFLCDIYYLQRENASFLFFYNKVEIDP